MGYQCVVSYTVTKMSVGISWLYQCRRWAKQYT